jgi:hypothetical protein
MNLMLKHWQNKEVAKSLIKKFYVFLQPGIRDYILSTTASSSAYSAHDFYADTVATAYADDDLVLTVTTGTGAANADTLIVVSDTNTLLVGDVESGGGTTALVTPDLNGDAAAGNRYYAFTNQATRPLDIIHINRCQRPTNVGEDTVLAFLSQPMDIMQREGWANLSSRSADGTASRYWYEELLDNAILHVWPEPHTAGEFLECWGQVTIDDMDASADNFALPSKWYAAVMWNLALWLTPKYGSSDASFKRIAGFAAMTLDDAEYGESEESIQFVPTIWSR